MILLNIFYILIVSLNVYSVVESKIYTAQTCEGHYLKLSCYFGDMITVLTADYGRWNATVCQYFDDPYMNLNCHSLHAEIIIKAKCNGRRSCKIKADNEHLLDPCPGQVKFAEAKYICVEKPNKENKYYQNYASQTQNRASAQDELINKGINALLNLSNLKNSRSNNQIDSANHNYTKIDYSELNPAYNPNFYPHFNKSSHENTNPKSINNGTIGWNIF